MGPREAAPLPVPPDSVIAGKYVVGPVIASGGMGVVAEGRHVELGQRVAIKFLLPEGRDRDEAARRFLREARAAARVESDHVVRVFDVGTHEGVPYMVMEYLEGEDLDAYMQRLGTLEVTAAVGIVVEALEGLARAHALGIVHRDLKPSNLFLAIRTGRNRSRRVKVLDFGISKVVANDALSDPTLTSTKSMMGSPGYMSPEQVRSTKGVDARTDVWSMGVILYELLTGEPAFTGESLGDVFAKIREEPLAPLRSKRPEVPPALDAVIMRCLERDRTRRYDDGAALLDALIPFASAEATGASRGAILVEEPSSDARAVRAEAATMPAQPSRQANGNTVATWALQGGGATKRRWAVAGAGAAAIATLGLAWVYRSASTGVAVASSATAVGETSVALGAGAPTVTAPSVQPSSEPTGGPTVEASAVPSATASAGGKVFGKAAPGARGPLVPRTAPSIEPAAPQSTAPPTTIPKKKDDLGI